jgi:hypothetical protein
MGSTSNCGGCEAVACESVWVCGRGQTRLACQLRTIDQGFELELQRNTRVYAVYRFAERVAAMTFAARFKHAFEGNGWTAA